MTWWIAIGDEGSFKADDIVRAAYGYTDKHGVDPVVILSSTEYTNGMARIATAFKHKRPK